MTLKSHFHKHISKGKESPSYLDLELITQIVSLLGSLSVILLFTIPYKDILEIYYTKKTDKFPFLVLIVTIFNTFFFCLYGLQVNQLGIIIPNTYGLTINVIFWLVYVFCMNLTIKKKTIFSLGTLIFIPLAFNVWLWSSFSKEVTGFFAMICSLSLSASPMQNITKCLAEKDNSYIPIRIVSIILLSSVLYLIFAFLVSDKILMITNTWGIITSTFQIIVYLKYSNSNIPSLTKEKENSYKTIEETLNKISYLKDSHNNSEASEVEEVQEVNSNDSETQKII